MHPNRPVNLRELENTTHTVYRNTNFHIDDTASKNRFYKKCNPELKSVDILPNIETLNIGGGKIFNNFNETEYSANIDISDAALPFGLHYKPGQVNHTVRTYIKGYKSIYSNADGSIISTTRGKLKEIPLDIIVRLDESYPRIGGYVEFGKGKRPNTISVKVKAIQESFNCKGVSYNLSKSLEVDLKNIRFDCMHRVKTSFTKRLAMTYWAVKGTFRKASYTFRVCFRSQLDADDPRKFECNIECEDPISGSNFEECFDALFWYYKGIYETCFGKIEPLGKVYMPHKLNPRQIEFLNSLELEVTTNEEIPTRDEDMEDIISILGLQVLMANVDPNIKVYRN